MQSRSGMLNRHLSVVAECPDNDQQDQSSKWKMWIHDFNQTLELESFFSSSSSGTPYSLLSAHDTAQRRVLFLPLEKWL